MTSDERLLPRRLWPRASAPFLAGCLLSLEIVTGAAALGGGGGAAGGGVDPPPPKHIII